MLMYVVFNVSMCVYICLCSCINTYYVCMFMVVFSVSVLQFIGRERKEKKKMFKKADQLVCMYVHTSWQKLCIM